jgi:hypothetical protein
MDVVDQGISGKQNQLYCWNKKKINKCPTCKESIFQFDGSPQFSSVPVTNEIVQIHHMPCPSSIGNCGKAIFFCLSCGSHSSQTLGRLKDRGCKCDVVNNTKAKRSQLNPKEDGVVSNNDVGFEVDNTYEPASEDIDQTEVKVTTSDEMNQTEGSEVGINHHGYEYQGCEVVIELNATSPLYPSPLNILLNQKEWPSGSSRFFIRDKKNQGDGLKGLVFNYLINTKSHSEFSSLTGPEMFFHLHVASIHYGLTTSKSIDLTSVMLQNRDEHIQLMQSERQVLSNAYQNSIVEVLTHCGVVTNHNEISILLQEIQEHVQTQLQSNHCSRYSNNLSAPVKHKRVRSIYIGVIIPLSKIYQFQQLAFAARLLTSQR